MCPVNSKTVTQWKPHQPSMNQRIPLITFFRASLPIYGTLFSKLKLHIYYISEFLMQIRSSWASCSSQMKFWAVIQISSVSDVMMDVHTSQINCERSTLLHKYKHSGSHVCGWEALCASRALTSLLSLGITCYRWLLHEGNGLKSRGKILLQRWPLFESALNVSVFWESCSPDLISLIKAWTPLALWPHPQIVFKHKSTNTW